MSLSVLHVSQPCTHGVTSWISRLVHDQARRGWEVAVACPQRSAVVAPARSVGARHLAWEALREPRLSVIAETRRLASIVRAVEPDIVHLHSAKAGLAGRLALRGERPTVFQPHGWSFHAGGRPTHTFALAWERVAARWTSAIVCVSDGERNEGERNGIRATWRVVPNGIDTRAFAFATDQDRRAARQRIGLGPGALAVCVGRLARQKGQDLLLDAWPHVRASLPEGRLVLVGDGPDRGSLLGRGVAGVDFVGHREDVRDWIAAADVVVIPSRWEGMATTVLEAMACGRSIVATDVAGAREVLRGRAGAVVPIDDARALAEALLERLTDRALAAAEGKMGRVHAETQHDARRIPSAIAGVYREIVGEFVPPHGIGSEPAQALRLTAPT
jgi:glycosyltransferase involved in cell wall biosynthesis